MAGRALGGQRGAHGRRARFGDCLCLSYSRLVVRAPKALTNAGPRGKDLPESATAAGEHSLAAVAPVGVRALVGVCVTRSDVCVGEVRDPISYRRSGEGNFT